MNSKAPPTTAAPRRDRRRGIASLLDPETLRSIIDTIAEGTYVATPEGRIVDANPAFVSMIGADSLEQIEEHSVNGLWPESAKRVAFMQQVIEQGSVSAFELRAQRLDGEVITVLDTCHARTVAGEVVALCGVLLDVTEHKTLQTQLDRLSVRDPLTGCYNRRYLQAQRPFFERPSYFYGCMVLDLDDLKETNRTYGDEEGDRVLQRFAHFVIRNKRADDVLVRLDSDEFALFLEVVSPDNLELIARRLMENAPNQAPSAFRIGYAYRRPGESLEQVLARADAAMYEATGMRDADYGRGQRDADNDGEAA
jgi:diguanylate cyclase (GGDEF)-like protein/PAS domain S-box-containing protein